MEPSDIPFPFVRLGLMMVSLLFVIQLSLQTLLAQSQLLKIPIDVKPNAFNMLPDSAGNWNIFMKDVEKYYFLMIDKDGKVIKKSEVSRKYESTNGEKEFIGGKGSPDGFYFYFRDKDPAADEYFSSYFLSNKEEGDKHNIKYKLFDGKKETLVKVFPVNNSFYAMVFNRKSKQVKFLEFLDEKNTKSYSFHVDEETAALLKKGTFRVFRNNKISRIENLLFTKKLFVDQKDEFVMVHDNSEESGEGGSTVLRFKLQSETVDKIIIPNNPEDKVSTSWYLENKLYKFSLAKNKIAFYVVDLNTKNVVKKYEYAKGDKITIANDNVIREKHQAFLAPSSQEALEKDKEIFKEFMKGNVFIKISAEDTSSISLLLGSYRVVETGGGLAAKILVGAALGAAGVVFVPGMGQVRITWFNTLLNKEKYAVINSAAPLPEVVRLEECIGRLPISGLSKESIVSAKIGQKMFVAYFDYPAKEIKILEVD